MKLNNIKIEMKNIYGLDIKNEDEIRNEIKNFCLSDIEKFNSKNQGTKLIFEVMDYINENFVFNKKNELLELTETFLNKNKKELIGSLNPYNFEKEVEYGDEEFCFHIFDILSLIHHFSYKKLQSEIKERKLLENFKINKKRIKNSDLVVELVNILKIKSINLSKIKILNNLFFCDNTTPLGYFMAKRNTAKIKKLEKEKKAIDNYFKNKELNFEIILNYLRELNLMESQVNRVNEILIELYNN